MSASTFPDASLTRDPQRHYLQSPYYFMCCSLFDPSDDVPVPVPPSTALTGTLVSSLHRLKDVDNNGTLTPVGVVAVKLAELTGLDGGFFVFGDLSVKVEGDFRLKFTLFEMRKDMVTHIKSIISDRFTGKIAPRSFSAKIVGTDEPQCLPQRAFLSRGR
ncbi:unnamed protein product [Aspergillus oryzae RIB40]|uniref:DNA, SC003 n=1 Tax=Aspergillus oryzae (strain ATCC 42149 / RIB 40) TaxID=510516 RepID=Q2UJP9_ASPOR|nr:unnamed protein product [Aspergillus oryzae RIB40]BAE58216.1 unnamed protein product [Aspergillus oryzae RIB40]